MTNNIATSLGIKSPTTGQYAHSVSTLPDADVKHHDEETDDAAIVRDNLHHLATSGNKILDKLLTEMASGIGDHKTYTAAAELIKALAGVNKDIAELFKAASESSDIGDDSSNGEFNAKMILDYMLKNGTVEKR